MVIEKKINNNSSIGFDDSSTFTVTPDEVRKVLEMLSDGIYSDNYGSIIREICSNCLDSNVLSGNSHKSVIVKYNSEDQTISFQDFGEGMSPVFMKGGYCKVGYSTKEQSNDALGCWGLGRLSIFSYTKYYNVTTVYNSIKYQYLISEDSGKAEVDLLDTEYTEEDNNTIVFLKLVDHSDFYKFQSAVKQQLKYFDNVITEGFSLDNNYTIYKGENFRWRTDGYQNGLELCLGNVYYPIDWGKLGMQKVFLNCAVYFPIDSGLIPTISRESIKYTPETIQIIKEKINLLLDEMYSLWEPQKYCNTVQEYDKKKNNFSITVDDQILKLDNISSDWKYIFNPINGLNISPRMFKSYYIDILGGLFTDCKVKQHNGGWLTDLQNVAYTTDSQWSKYKASRVEFKRLIKKKEYDYKWMISRLFSSDKIEVRREWDVIQGEWVNKVYNHYNVDYKWEIDYICNVLYNQILPYCQSFDTYELPKKERTYSAAAKLENKQIRTIVAHRLQYYNNRSKQVIDLAKFKSPIIVYCNEKEEYDRLCDLIYSSNEKPTYIELLQCAKLYNKKLEKLENSYNYEEFLRSNFVKKKYEKYLKKEIYRVVSFIYPNFTYFVNIQNYLKVDYLRNNYKNVSQLCFYLNETVKELHKNEYLEKELKEIQKLINNLKTFEEKQTCDYYKLYQHYKKKNK